MNATLMTLNGLVKLMMLMHKVPPIKRNSRALRSVLLFCCLVCCFGVMCAGCLPDGGNHSDATTVCMPEAGCGGDPVWMFDFQSPPPQYYFIRMNDRSGANGANIDAISITKKNTKWIVYASRIEIYAPANEEKLSETRRAIDNILGEPTAFGSPFDRQNVGPDKPCSLAEEHALSLGGDGGYVIVSFDSLFIEEGDIVTVYEAANCLGQGTSAPLEVQVGFRITSETEWITIFSAQQAPLMSAEVKDLPVIK